MNSHSGTKDNNIRRTKATAAIPMAGAIVTAALLLSGLSLITSYQPVIAQENMTGGGGATTTDNATSTMGGNATTATNAGGGANQSTSDVRMNIEQARMALQNNDTQGARMYLDMALSALGGGTQSNMTSTTGGTTNATTGGGILGGNQSAGGILGGTTDGGGGGGGTTDGGGGGPLAGIFGGGP
jgi:hypothetical protein